MSLAAALERLEPETVERACAGDRGAVENLAATFEALGCPYQQARTGVLAQLI